MFWYNRKVLYLCNTKKEIIIKHKPVKKTDMEAITIAHLTGQMDTILEMIEFSIHQISMEDYQYEYLMEQMQKANAVNDEIFELHKKNELDRIKKTYNNGSDESE